MHLYASDVKKRQSLNVALNYSSWTLNLSRGGEMSCLDRINLRAEAPCNESFDVLYMKQSIPVGLKPINLPIQ